MRVPEDYAGDVPPDVSHSGAQAPESPPFDVLRLLVQRWRSAIGITLLAGVLGLGASFLIKPRFTATTLFIPPQQQNAASSLASLGALSGLLGAAQKSTSDEYVTLLKSTTVADRLVDKFALLTVYDEKFRFLARDELAKRSQITVGQKDGLIKLSVEDTDPKRAAAIANQYVEELKQVTSTLAVSEAQRRRMFFEKQLNETKVRLAAAQTALQGSGYSSGALKAEPRSAAESYARLRAELTAAEVSLQTLRGSRAEGAPEVQQLSAHAQALREQIASAEQSAASAGTGAGADYVSKYREFKYQETLFDLMAKQYELARVDEAREGALIQVVDFALVPEHKSSPRRAVIAVGAAVAGVLAFYALLVLRQRRTRTQDTYGHRQ